MESGTTRAQHVTMDTLTEGTVIRSLVLGVHQSQPGAHVLVYMDCVYQGKISTPRSLRDMFAKMSKPDLQVVRSKDYIHIFMFTRITIRFVTFFKISYLINKYKIFFIHKIL